MPRPFHCWSLSMTPRSLLLILLSLSPSLSPSLLWADELVVPVGQQGSDRTALKRPATGLTAQAVETQFGAPLQKSTPVGQPPISNWEYPEYRVFFEGDRVLHSVLKPMSSEPVAAPAVPAAPAPAPAEAAPAETTPVETAPAEAAPVAATSTPAPVEATPAEVSTPDTAADVQ